MPRLVLIRDALSLALPLTLAVGCTRASADVDALAPPLGAGWEAGISQGCLPVYSSNWRPVAGHNRVRPTSLPRPERGKPFVEPTFKTCVVRVTDHAADNVPGFARNDYSRRQAFNADGSRIAVSAYDGTWHLYDPEAQRYIGRLEGVGGDAEPQWHPTNPNLLYYVPPFGVGMQIRELDVTTGKSRIAADLASRIKAIWPTANAAWTRSEGSPSADGRYWGLMVDEASSKGLGMLTYDLRSDQVLATYDYAKNGKDRPDHVSMSPTGEFIVVAWNDGPYSFARDFTRPRKLQDKGEHSDLTLDADGEDTFVSVDYEGAGGPVYATNLRTGLRTNLFLTYVEHTATSMHFSGKAFNRPGWVLISTYAESGSSWQWLHGNIFAVELKPHPRIVNLAHHHVAYNQYFTEPHASVNRDFTRVVFNSNWETKSKTDIDTYMIEVPKSVTAPGR